MSSRNKSNNNKAKLQGQKFTLTLKDRVIFDSVLPKNFSHTTKIILDDIIKKIILTQAEILKYEIKTEGNGSVSWNNLGTKATFNIEFTELELIQIRGGLKALDEKEALNADTDEIYKIFSIK